MMRTVLCFLFLLITGSALAQQDQFTVKGKILDSISKQPLAGASVFCQNTTKGTITNADGEFSIRLPNGGYDLIISYTSYESAEIRINNSTIDTLIIELKQKDMSLSEVVVSGSNEVADGLDKYGQFFLDHFIGTTPNAAHCKLKTWTRCSFFSAKKGTGLK